MVSGNPIVTEDAMPGPADEPFLALSPRYLWSRLALMGAFCLVAWLLAVVAWLVLDMPGWGLLALLGGSLAVAGIYAGAETLAYRHMGYQVRQHECSLRTGILWRSISTVPFARVQHAVLRRGPLDRLAGLSLLDIRTAGGHLVVPGLPLETAERLRALVVERAGLAAEQEAEHPPGTGVSGPSAPTEFPPLADPETAAPAPRTEFGPGPNPVGS